MQTSSTTLHVDNTTEKSVGITVQLSICAGTPLAVQSDRELRNWSNEMVQTGHKKLNPNLPLVGDVD